MKARYGPALFRKILVPLMDECECTSALTVAKCIAGSEHLLLMGIVPVLLGQSLSTATLRARRLRERLRQLSAAERLRGLLNVRVSHYPFAEIMAIVQSEEVDLLVLEWPRHFEVLGVSPGEVFANPPCDIAIVGGLVPACPQQILVPMRGGPYAELALRLALSIAQTKKAQITALHFTPRDGSSAQDAAFRGLERILASLKVVQRLQRPAEDPAAAIIAESHRFDLIVVGATSQTQERMGTIGPVAERLLNEHPAGVIVVKTKRPLPADLGSELVGQQAISVLVDKWFAENTYHADEFSDLKQLYQWKRQQGVSISLALPALNEEATVGNVIQTVKTALMDEVPLLDEVVLIDSASTDRTREIACSLGVPVYIHQETLSRLGSRSGKGEALWKSLYLTRGDIILWVDTDIVNIHPRFVYGILGPLLQREDIQFVKGFYKRPLKVGDRVQAGGGGRVTELTARPLINLFYPELSGVIQPLSGEYGGRRTALEKLPFFSGYGVEIGLLIDVFEQFGLDAIAQVDLLERVHHNQPLEALSKMSFAIIQAVSRKLERRFGVNFLEEVNKTMKLIRYEAGRLYLEVEEIAELERPPMIEVSEYLEARKLWTKTGSP